MRFVFLMPQTHQFLVDWEARARRITAEFRADCRNMLEDPILLRLVDELSAGSPDFARFWKQHDVLERQGGERRFLHPKRGEIAHLQATLRPDATPSLEKAAELAQSYATAPLLVRGHTDGKGSDSYNDALSLRRADAVAQVLQSRTGRTVKTEGLGKRQPIAPNTTPDGQDDPEGRQKNRRVQILIGVPKSQ
ncbi:hypothetical protein SDC9_185630 [bioreactor metagenome]|uniref:OmpA-like domain-containing protein n=1 Tax=bioreactor metagenome TaxID=1076179 RepID=A0A645HHP3_9ZZZZ